jgi:hypothetical protein
VTEGIIVVHARTGQQSIKKLGGANLMCNAQALTAQYACPLYTAQRNIIGLEKRMSHSDLIKEIVGTYQKHGWRLRRVLLRPETRAELDAELASGSLPLDGVKVEEGSVDGLWFSRPSHEGREAWELRLLAENPFALFETFEKDETEEQREEMRREMEARLRDYVNNE